MRRLIVPLMLASCLATLAILSSRPADGVTISGYFTDDNGSTFENDIDAIAQAGITKGCNPPANSLFCPTENVDRGAMAAFIRRALGLPSTTNDYFTDDGTSIFEEDINALAAAGIAKGCNPPDNTRYCPTRAVDRGAMAAFLKRALNLPIPPTDFFTDDESSTFEADINAVAAAGITKGCNPPSNTRYCPTRDVSRGEMAAFLRRALGLPPVILEIPAGGHPAMACVKSGERCTLTVDLSAGRLYRIQEGIFQVQPPSAGEQAQFQAGDTEVTITIDGSDIAMTELGSQIGGGLVTRRWRKDVTFAPGTHTVVARWTWAGDLIQTNTLTIRSSG